MRIVILVENNEGKAGCAAEHGLSVYVETEKHKILADTGASNLLLQNAAALGIDLSAVNAVFLSHGHYDHAGGILGFCEQNQTARIFLQESAAAPYYVLEETEDSVSGAHTVQEKFIGIDERICSLPNVVLLQGDVTVDEEIELFTGVTARRFWPEGNRCMRKKVGEEMLPDIFDHEQSLVIHGEKEILICGCAHCGILNITDRYRDLYERDPDIVIGGFHMRKKTAYTQEEADVITQTAAELASKNTVYYTGHCTGNKALALMAPILKEKLVPLHAGLEIQFSE